MKKLEDFDRWDIEAALELVAALGAAATGSQRTALTAVRHVLEELVREIRFDDPTLDNRVSVARALRAVQAKSDGAAP